MIAVRIKLISDKNLLLPKIPFKDFMFIKGATRIPSSTRTVCTCMTVAANVDCCHTVDKLHERLKSQLPTHIVSNQVDTLSFNEIFSMFEIPLCDLST